jgi:uncharacterized protein (TIGR02421 family)
MMHAELETTLRLDRMLVRVASLARPVPSLTPDNAASERARLVQCLHRGEHPVPLFTPRRQRVDPEAYRCIDQARLLAEGTPAGALYGERLAELELDLAILDAWGDSERVRPLCLRRYGRADERVQYNEASTPLREVARAFLSALPPDEPQPATLTAAGEGRSVAALIQRAALGLGIEVDVRIEPRLASLAATGERTVFLADRLFSEREARRLVAHEVFGHLVVAANARAQPLRLLQVGLAGAFADQEGLALYLEEALGLMSRDRLRTLSARVIATDWLYAGASFGDTASALFRDHGFAAEAAVLVAERTYRGGGVARDAGYLAGYLRVRAAITSGQASLDELRRGRVSLTQLGAMRDLEQLGWVVPAVYRPSFALSRRLTLGGTSADTSPPSDAASLTMFELT